MTLTRLVIGQSKQVSTIFLTRRGGFIAERDIELDY